MTKRVNASANDKANFIEQKQAAQKRRKRRIKQKAIQAKSRKANRAAISGVCKTGISEKICLCIDCMLRRDKEEHGLKAGRVGM